MINWWRGLNSNSIKNTELKFLQTTSLPLGRVAKQLKNVMRVNDELQYHNIKISNYSSYLWGIIGMLMDIKRRL